MFLLLWMAGFDPRPVYVIVLVDKVAFAQVFLQIHWFSSVNVIPSVLYTHCLIICH
jgi:hypothetical protein